MTSRIIGPLAALTVAIGCTIVAPAIWPITAALATISIINIRTQLRKEKE
ncbi:hypothetical protein [Corynebacterium diphtheriae]|nr:hypothetical protein [Corynebacterium diphtheriae]ERA51607.1 putative secreted protein [Corynebacterium diphtheriae str. Aberdeen]KLN37669.1 hypothetical protein AL08_10240 [Corynebacterium diphtheriae bv. gravis str. ISS 4746]KLN43439.1 hypothetical protein AL09_10280 [Corynebacterium diphtheriae bv. gravis str. ISS 4749]MBG9246773.1 hypothetical protein [Corynebacterium diphtheriae bv. mitis]MBG9252676.1 hypothetical protein [Corynebacterium diphtheriae bv. mitis]